MSIENITIRPHFKPGDIGSITYLHGVLYAREYGFNHLIEVYVAAGLAEIFQSFAPGRDGIWVAEAEGRAVGSVVIAGRTEEQAQLRYFLIHPSCRGLGLGRALLDRAIGFCREAGYRSVFLWTAEGLEAAAHLYTSAGFVLTEKKTHSPWGREITEQRYELLLQA